MNNMQLPERFFEEYPLKEVSAASLTHFRMITVTMSDFEEQLDDTVIPLMNGSRYEGFLMEKAYVMNLSKTEDIVPCMRKIKDSVNTGLLIRTVIEYQDEVMPLVLKKICRSGYDVFIENAAVLLANVDTKYTEQLYDLFPDIRNAYARSELCIVFGVKKKAEYTSLLVEQFRKIKAERTDNDYEQGPLLALNLIYDMIG